MKSYGLLVNHLLHKKIDVGAKGLLSPTIICAVNVNPHKSPTIQCSQSTKFECRMTRMWEYQFCCWSSAFVVIFGGRQIARKKISHHHTMSDALPNQSCSNSNNFHATNPPQRTPNVFILFHPQTGRGDGKERRVLRWRPARPSVLDQFWWWESCALVETCWDWAVILYFLFDTFANILWSCVLHNELAHSYPLSHEHPKKQTHQATISITRQTK